jgi:hypothetical protein
MLSYVPSAVASIYRAVAGRIRKPSVIDGSSVSHAVDGQEAPSENL